jgi:hypothetical protein
MSEHPTKEDLASIRRCVEWAIPQLNCGNMSKDEYWDYLMLIFARVDHSEVMRALAERLRLAEDEVRHLEYFRSRGDGGFFNKTGRSG